MPVRKLQVKRETRVDKIHARKRVGHLKSMKDDCGNDIQIESRTIGFKMGDKTVNIRVNEKTGNINIEIS